MLLVWQGVPMNWHSYIRATSLNAGQQVIPQGPAAALEIIKNLGTNGGGFFNVNGAHPYENPTPLSNFLELLAHLLIPAGLCCTFGEEVGARRQGGTVLAAMAVIFVPLTIACIAAEVAGVPALDKLVADQAATATQAG